MKIKSLVLFLSLALFGACTQKQSFMNDNNTPKGVAQARALWTEQDGTQADFDQLVSDYYCETDSERLALFESISRAFEQIYQSADMLTVELLRSTQLTNAAEPQTPDWILSGYSPLAHFSDDMFANKLAFITIINFPHYTLEEKNARIISPTIIYTWAISVRKMAVNYGRMI